MSSPEITGCDIIINVSATGVAETAGIHPRIHKRTCGRDTVSTKGWKNRRNSLSKLVERQDARVYSTSTSLLRLFLLFFHPFVLTVSLPQVVISGDDMRNANARGGTKTAKT
jgi:hypothetical protein